jgi:hypothetical protein
MSWSIFPVLFGVSNGTVDEYIKKMTNYCRRQEIIKKIKIYFAFFALLCYALRDFFYPCTFPEKPLMAFCGGTEAQGH